MDDRLTASSHALIEPSARHYELGLASILAWAAQRNIPFAAAIDTLASKRFRAVLCPQYEKSIHWLNQGASLSYALRKGFGTQLSPWFLSTIENAERQQELAVVLPHLAACLRFNAGLRKERAAALYFTQVKIANFMAILIGYLIFLVPRLMMIMRELIEDHSLIDHHPIRYLEYISAAMTCPFRMITGGSDDGGFSLLVFFACILILIPLCYLCVRLAPSTMAVMPESIVRYWSYFPLGVLNPKWLALSELSSGMYVHLASGKGMAESAERCRDTVARPWLRRRLDRFIAEVRAGEPWADAWARMKLGSPLHEWMIRNAAARENPAEGFYQLTAWLSEDIRRRQKNVIRFVDIASVFITAIVLGFVVFTFWDLFVNGIYFGALNY
jgi:type II secretory pathway component PulF